MTPLEDLPRARHRMVEEQVRRKGVTDPRVLEAMERVPRHRFVPAGLDHEAYSGSALPIGLGQTISAPQMVGLMTQALALTGSEKVLEVGTGSGYQAAVLAAITPRVFTIERVPTLARKARTLFTELGLEGIVVKVGDGTLGYPEAAPYDRILITAGGPEVPGTLWAQLADGGILVAPVGGREEQILMRYTRQGTARREEALCRCVFVPLLGQEGFEDGNP